MDEEGMVFVEQTFIMREMVHKESLDLFIGYPL
jgi:hypothetical protein